ncbi:SDR family NAD(P)-dependent oxidoreductase [Pseudomarimonas arenosa]|uniref:SDR family NAD(P)-dependent oxidoreductase n=1 Tax=Pseudomarimonas arenosa TaxID=2774145 RepID=A0AAW3ZRV3_9GAMM|nr:SDR family NAD(P)-dependent oxidoreductase [Pseudomarimonas arenosa]MBD8527309.1 SDR family NAD(P)-dependent oxidoreductase [Pseudomarimonas arenosa]
MQNWLITGASRGLGRALCLALAGPERRVHALARDADALRALASERESGQIVPLPLDLADREGLRQGLARCEAIQIGLHGLINNAGIGWYKPFLEHSEQELADLLQINLLAPMQICHAALPGMLQRGAGHIVNIGSDLGRRPLAKMAPYVASKHGLLGFSHSLLREYKDQGLRVSLVNPGIIDTGFGGSDEHGERDPQIFLKPEQLAALVMSVIEQPDNLVVDEVSVHPALQFEF